MAYISGVASLLLATTSIPSLIGFWSGVYDANEEIMKSVAKCESGYNISVCGDNGLSCGIFQFQKPTFSWMAKEYQKETVTGKLDYYNAEDQIRLAVWAISRKGYGSHWYNCYFKPFVIGK